MKIVKLRMLVDRWVRPIPKERFDEIIAELIRDGIAEEFIGEHGETRYRLRDAPESN